MKISNQTTLHNANHTDHIPPASLHTRVVQAGEKQVKPFHSLLMPVVQTSTYTFADTADLCNYMETKLWGDETEREEYGRYGNPTIAAAERK